VPSPTELRPWQSGESILDAVRRFAAAGDEGFELPDEPPEDPTQIRWSAGSRDGVTGRHMAAPAPETGLLARARRRLSRPDDPPARIHAALVPLARRGGDRERLAVYRAAQDPDLVVHVDAVLERLVEQPDVLAALAPHARWLVAEARHRGPAKLGIALLGMTGGPEDLGVIKTLGRHEEFTLYCAVAIGNLLADPVDALWEVARAAQGWGRIETVERLAPLVADRPDVKRWLLVDGCRNSVMEEYLAHACATAGELADALTGDIDDALLDGACTIVTALCEGGPAEDIDDYADGPRAVELLLGHLRTRCTTLDRLEAVLAVRDWLAENAAGNEPVREVTDEEARRAELGWTPGVRDRVSAACGEILARAEWPERVRSAFASGDPRRQWIAWRIAPVVGVDLWEDAFALVQAGPLDGGHVFRVVNVPDRDRRRRVIAWAEANLPLSRIATGPERRLFAARETVDADHALTFVLQAMDDAELYSEALVAAALRSPVVGTRNAALSVLEARPRAQWGAQVEAALRQSAADDPDDAVRARVRAALDAG
jgi:hypothetical protein